MGKQKCSCILNSGPWYLPFGLLRHSSYPDMDIDRGPRPLARSDLNLKPAARAV